MRKILLELDEKDDLEADWQSRRNQAVVTLADLVVKDLTSGTDWVILEIVGVEDPETYESHLERARLWGVKASLID